MRLALFKKTLPLLLRVFIFFLFIITFQSSLLAQDKDATVTKSDTLKGILPKKPDVTAPETQKEIKTEKKLATKIYSIDQFAHESVLYAKQPTKWKGNDWLRLGIVVAATAAAMPFDKGITNSTQGQQRYYYSPLIVGGRVYGEWYSIGGVAGIFGAYGLIAHDTASKKIAIELLQAGIYAEITTEVLKIIVGRERPIATEEPFTFHSFTVSDYNFQSMPSGHATSAFALSTVMSRHAPTTFLKILAYVPAGFTMFSRIYQHQHWLSDEVPGAAIGFFVGNWVVDLHEGKRHRINVTSMYPVGISYSLDKVSP
jgi:hypothetical protein